MKNIIKEQRILLNMTVTTLSKLVGTSEDEILLWEKGETEPLIPEIIKLSQIFHISIDDFVEVLANQKKRFSNDEKRLEEVGEVTKSNLKKSRNVVLLIVIVVITVISVFSLTSYLVRSSKYNRLQSAMTNFANQEEFTFYEIYKGFKDLGDFRKSKEVALLFEDKFRTIIEFVNQVYQTEFAKLYDLVTAGELMLEIQEYHQFSSEMLSDFYVAFKWNGIWDKDSGRFSSAIPYNVIVVDVIHGKVRGYVNEYFFMDYLIEEIDTNHYVAYFSDSSTNFSIELYDGKIRYYVGDLLLGTFSRYLETE